MTQHPGTKTTSDRPDLAEDARNTWRQSRAAEMPLSGAALGRMFERSERWGRDRIAEVRAQDHAKPADTASVTDQGKQPVGDSHAGEAPDTAEATAKTDTRQADIPTADIPTADKREAGGPLAGAASSSVALASSPPPVKELDPAVPLPPPPPPPTPAPFGAQEPARESALHPAGFAADDRRAAGAPSAASVPQTGWVWWCALAAVLVVGVVALATSYDHMRILARDSGEGWRAWMLPVSVDGLMVAASVTILARRRAGHRRGGALAWCALCGGVAASVAANVAAAQPHLVAQLVAAWPPLAALAGVELLMQHIRMRDRDQS